MWKFPWFENLLQDIRFGVRMLRKNPGFTAVAVGTLALGIGVNTAIFSVVKTVLLDALPYRQPQQLVRLAAGGPKDREPSTVSYSLVEDWKERTHSFQSIAAYGNWTPTISGDARPEILSGLRVTHNFFATLGVSVALGRDFEESDDRPDRRQVVILSHNFWKNRFANSPSVVGQTITLSQLSYEVIGVLPQEFQPLVFRFGPAPPQVWAPLGYRTTDPPACRACRSLRSVARLNAGSSAREAQVELNSVMPRLVHEFSDSYPPGFRGVVTPLETAVVGNVRSAVWMLFGATGFVLLIACVNVASLLLSRAAVRRREMSVRLALGCARTRLVRQMLTETTMLTIIGGATGLLLAPYALHAFLRWAPADIPRLPDVRIDRGVLLFVFLVSVIAGQLAGLVPALAAARVDQRESLQPSSRGSVSHSRRTTRALVIACEVALAFALASGAGLLLRSLANVLAISPGFDTHDLFTTNVGLVGPNYTQPARVVEFHRQMLDRIESIPGVEAAGIVSTLPLAGGHDRRGLQVQDRPLATSSAAPLVDAYFVSPGYFKVMGIPLKVGRFFDEADVAPDAAPVAIVSESAARQEWPQGDALGKHVQLGARNDSAPWATVVGIVGDIRQYSLDSSATPEAYLTYPQAVPSITFPTVVVRGRLSPGTLEKAVEESVAAIDKTLPVFLPASMQEVIADSVARRRFLATLITWFGVLALALSSLGVYGVMAYQVSCRTGEIGLRMALGATPGAVMRSIVQSGMAYVLAGLALGGALGLACAQILKSQLFGVQVTDAVTFLVASAALCSIAFVACYLPARRATKVDPMVALRYECRPASET